jgi:ribosomal protein S18 acetylase RimI-like enzyme
MLPTAGFDVGLVQDDSDLAQILELQQRNLARQVTAAEAAAQGFVTVEHSLEVLQRMHAITPSVVAKRGTVLSGYALMMPVECRAFVPVLEPMFGRMTQLRHRGQPLLTQRMYIMGQICVAAAFRGQGVFDALYDEHRRQHALRFDFTITEVALSNTRSMRAHERVGFQTIDRYRDATNEWAIMLWDFKATDAKD